MNNLDRAVNNEFLIVSKSLLPYLNIDKQRSVAIFIKVMELVYTVNLFSNETSVRSMSRSQETGWEKDFLKDVRNNLPSDKAYFVDAILKLTEVKDLLTSEERVSTDSTSTTSNYHLHPSDSGILDNTPFPTHSEEQTSEPISPSSTKTPSSTSMTSPEQLISGLSSFLDPNQTQLLKAISSLLIPNH